MGNRCISLKRKVGMLKLMAPQRIFLENNLEKETQECFLKCKNQQKQQEKTKFFGMNRTEKTPNYVSEFRRGAMKSHSNITCIMCVTHKVKSTAIQKE